MDKLKFTLRDLIYLLGLATGMALTYGTLSAQVSYNTEQVKDIPSIKSDIEVIKSATLDTRDRIKRIEGKLMRSRD